MATFRWPFCGDFCGDFSAEIITPVARDLVFCSFEAFFRALEMTKRRRIGAGFIPVLRRLLLLCLRATLLRAVFFLFSINNNRPAAAQFGSEKSAQALRHANRAVSAYKMTTRPLNFGNAPTPEDRRGFMLAPFGQNSRRNRRQNELLTLWIPTTCGDYQSLSPIFYWFI